MNEISKLIEAINAFAPTPLAIVGLALLLAIIVALKM